MTRDAVRVLPGVVSPAPVSCAVCWTALCCIGSARVGHLTKDLKVAAKAEWPC